jgi:pyridoxal phosphate enzyme (YggS family)
MIIKQNIEQILQSLPKGCTLIAVSKTHPPEAVQEAYAAGHRVFGENKVQELLAKYEVLPKDIQWHLIGHLQSNKVKYIAPFIHLIHSIDSLKLLQEVNKQAQKNNRIIACLLQVYIAKEESKFGLSPEEVIALLEMPQVKELSSVKITGLMGMATFTDDTLQIRAEFKTLKQLFESLKSKSLGPNISMQELSMGMSSDYPIALEEGSTMVRVGSAIFGNRNYAIA